MNLEPSAGLAVIAGTALVGSVHCVGMCGGLALACAPDRAHAAWQAGRLVAYVGLGLAAGAAGQGLDLAGEALLDVQRAAGLVLGTLLVVLAVRALRPATGRVLITERARPSRLARLKAKFGRSAFAVGLLTALLPCGWLWSFLALAGASGSPLRGAAVMSAFWIGAVPALATFAYFAGRLAIAPALRRNAPRITAVMMLAAGLLTVAGKLGPGFDPLSTAPQRTEDCLHP
jgi:sulfite exporter TauE/SafE